MAEQIDQYGAETLDAISVASRFNRWMYKTIKPFSKNDIIEIGSGIGNISQFFVTDGSNIRLSDINEAYLSFLRDKYGKQANVLEILNIDISHSDFTVRYASLLEKSDTVFSLNVLEHVEDEKLALENYLSLIKPGGNIIILVPAYQSLYCNFDRELGHYRRYNRKSLMNLALENGIIIEKCFTFNAMGIIGWFFSGKVLKKKQIPGGQMKIFDFFVPLFKLIDWIFFRRVGLSIILAGRKEKQPFAHPYSYRIAAKKTD